MKIALLAAFHIHDHGWSIPIAIENELECLGHQVDRFNLYILDDKGAGIGYGEDGLKNFLDQQSNYDFLLHCDYGQFNSSLLSYINIPTVMEAGDDPQSFQYNFPKAQYFNYILSPDKKCVEAYKGAGLKCIWWTHFADPQIYKPYNDINSDKFVVTTCETGRQNGIINYLRNKLNDIDQNIWLDDRFFYGVDHGRFMCRGKIVFQASRFGEVTRRIFEAAACKRMILTDRLDITTGIYDIFPENVAAVYYTSWSDAVDKILYYRDHSDEMNRIATAGYNTVISSHTVSHRVNILLDMIEKTGG